MFRIGDFSRLSGISVRMLRHYDKLGLLCPCRVDPQTGFRYYAAAQLARVSKVQRLKELGFSLAVIGEMLEKDDVVQLETYFSLRQAEIEQELQQVTAQAKLLSSAMSILKGEHSMMEYTVVLKEIPAHKVASVRGKLRRYEEEGMLWGKLYESFHALGVQQPKEPYMAAVFHDKDYKDSDPDVEVQTEVEGDYTDTGSLHFYTTQKVQVASVTFSGPYDQIAEVSQAAGAWIEDQGYHMAGTMFNIYHVGMPAENDPEKWVTETCFPVRK